MSLQCAEYVAAESEDESFQILGSEEGWSKNMFANGDIVYLNKGTSSGVKPGDVFTAHRVLRTVRHPQTNKKLGVKVATSGWVKVILAEENAATAVVEQACEDMIAGEYLKPFQKVQVPMVPPSAPADRLTPPSGKLNRTVVDLSNDVGIVAAGEMVTIDAGVEDGVAPGSVWTVYRLVDPKLPTPRNVIGEATVIAVQPRTATAKLTHSAVEVRVGDAVEMR
jgi:hypothetical protein